jgi:hypothetical protein
MQYGDLQGFTVEKIQIQFNKRIKITFFIAALRKKFKIALFNDFKKRLAKFSEALFYFESPISVQFQIINFYSKSSVVESLF